MKKFLLPLMLLLLLTALPVLAEAPDSVTITLTSDYYAPSIRIEEAEFTQWLRALMSADAPCVPPDVAPADKLYAVTFHSGGHEEAYTVYHDSLYNVACVTRPDGTVHSVSADLPMMLSHCLYEPASFNVKDEHRALLARHGWTVAFLYPHEELQLPVRLEASRTDATALHFVWADLFLRDAGYDITPWLGQTVIPYVYTLYETVNRIAWAPNDARLLNEDGTGGVLYNLRAVVLEHDGQVIGAYLVACSWDGSNLLSLDGSAPLELLGGMSIREYLLSKLPSTAEEQALATLAPEEIIRRYGACNDPLLMDIAKLLQRLGTANNSLFRTDPLQAVPTGRTVRSVETMYDSVYEADEGQQSYYPRLVYESPETGWKVESYYNTGM